MVYENNELLELKNIIFSTILLSFAVGLLVNIISIYLDSREDAKIILIAFILSVFAICLIVLVFLRVIIHPKHITSTIEGLVTFCSKQNEFTLNYFYSFYALQSEILKISKLLNLQEKHMNELLLNQIIQTIVVRFLCSDLLITTNAEIKEFPISELGEKCENDIMMRLGKFEEYNIQINKNSKFEKKNNKIHINTKNNKIVIECSLLSELPISRITHRPVPNIFEIPLNPLFEEDLTKSASDLSIFLFNIRVKIDFKRSRLRQIRNSEKLEDELYLFKRCIDELVDQLDLDRLRDNIFRKIDLESYESFFDAKRNRISDDKKKI